MMKQSQILHSGRKISTVLAMSTILGASLFANDNLVLEFEKKRVSQNPNVKVKDIKINKKKELAIAGWTGYIIDIDAVVQGKEIKAKDFLFTNGTHIAPELIDLKTTSTYELGKYKDSMQMHLYPVALFNEENIVTDEFEFLVTDFKEIYSETYPINLIDSNAKLAVICNSLIEFLNAKSDLITDKKIFGLD